MIDPQANTDSEYWRQLSPSERRLIALTLPGFAVADLYRKQGFEPTVEQEAFMVMMFATVLDGFLPPALFQDTPDVEGGESHD